MAKINNSTVYPVTAPALDDTVIGTDKSNTTNSVDGETVQFSLSGIADVISATVSAGSGLSFDTRADAIAANTGSGTHLTVGGLHYEFDAGGNALTTADGRTWSPASGQDITPLHWGAAGDGVTDDAAEFEAMLDWLAASTGILATQTGSRRVVDLMGETYLLAAPLMIGKFDFNLDGAFELGCGPISGVTFKSGKLKASGSFPERIAGEIGSHMVYVGVTQSTSYQYGGDADFNMFEVLNIHFENVEFDCNFTTGGVWVENTHRTHLNNCTFGNIGVGCDGVATCIQSGGHPRGVTCLNQETVIRACRFEGNLRTDGLSDYPSGRDDFGGGAEVFAAQAVPSGAFTLNGSGVSGGEWVSPEGTPFYVEFQNSYVSPDAVYDDLSGALISIEGFADAARTTPVQEVLRGPVGGSKPRWVYSANKYAVITSITSSAPVAGTNAQIVCSTSYKAAAIRMQSHDFYIMECVMTAFEYAMVIRGRTGQVYANHPWSRQVLLEENARKVNVFGNYFDFTDVTLMNAWNNQFTGNSFFLGNCSLQLIATSIDQTAEGLLIAGNKFTENSTVEFLTEGTGTWLQTEGADTIKAQMTGNTFEGEGDYTQLNGYLTVFAGAKFGGNVTMGGFNITNLASPVENLHAANKIYVDTVAGGGGGDLVDGTLKTGSLWLDGFGRFNGALNVGGYATHDLGGSFGGNVTMGGFQITDLAAPTTDLHAANKAYVDSVASGGSFETAGSATVGGLAYNGTTRAAGQLYGGTTNPISTTRLNYDGNLTVNALSTVAALTCGTALTVGGFSTFGSGASFAGAVNMDGSKITNLATPTVSGDAANKAYVDSVAGGGGATAYVAGTASSGALAYNGTTRAAGQLYGGTTNPASTTRLNYDGNLTVSALSTVAALTAGGALTVSGFSTFGAGQFGGALNMDGNLINNVGTPLSNGDAANKAWVESHVATEIAAMSDYRLKENVRPSTEWRGVLDAVKIYDYEWIESEQTGTGVIAHELAEILPDAVLGEKDGVDVQRVRYDRLVPHLIEALKDAERRIERLEEMARG